MNITFFFPSFVFFTSFNILGVKNHRNQRNAGQKKPWMKQYSLAFKMSSLCVQPVTILFYSPTKVFFSSMHYESWYCTSWFLLYFLLLCKKNLLCCLYTFSPGSCKLPDPLYASSSWAQTNPAPSASPHTWRAEHFVFLASPVCQHTSQTEGLKYEFSITDTASPAVCFPVVCNYLAYPGSMSAVGPYGSLPTRMFYDSTILFKTSYQITDTGTGV